MVVADLGDHECVALVFDPPAVDLELAHGPASPPLSSSRLPT